MTEMLTATARVRLPDAAGGVDAFIARFADEALLERRANQVVIVHPRFGRICLSEEDGLLTIACASPTPATLSFAKMASASAIDQLAGPDGVRFGWTGAGAGSWALPFFREMRVAAVHDVTPRMRRLVLAGDAAHYAGGALHVRVLIPPAGRAPVWPHADEAGRMIWPKGPDALVPRVYTVRSVDIAQGEIAMDVALHAGASTPGADWARSSCVGSRVGLLGPGGAPVAAAAFNLFTGDETALPAIARMLQALPGDAKAIVRIEVEDEAEEQKLASPAVLDVKWLHRRGAAAGTTGLIEAAVRAVPLPRNCADLRVFAGCEQATARRLRAYLMQKRKVAKERLSIAAYWRLGHEGVDIGE
ncbi:siderophore-interacting protein [Xanthobacter flavus]|uniref:SIP domain-containing protein n=1 Tax=Xanthobacter flavus TaxID=281 RepID=UPI003726A9A6